MSSSDATTKTVSPESVADTCAAITEYETVLPVGRRTKTPLSALGSATLLSTAKLSGIVQYEPSEFTFSALAGTTLAEIETVLQDRHQYLPFDPPLVKSNATIGGTVATGLAGPGRFRYGGVRDFLLGVQLVTAAGEVVHGGGKVVKNAAGFDIPKLIVGSVGRLGVLTEVTFKVFPKPPAELTLRAEFDSHDDALSAISRFALSRYELDAIDYRPQQRTVYLRMRGQNEVNHAMAQAITNESSFQVFDGDQASAFWRSLSELSWHPNRVHLKTPVTTAQFLTLQAWAEPNQSVEIHLSVAGAIAWIAIESTELQGLHAILCQLEIEAIAVRGECNRWHWGTRERRQIRQRIKAAMDPNDRFPGSFQSAIS